MVTRTALREPVQVEVSLEATQKVMESLIQPGTPLGKLAFWNSACTIRTKLSITGQYAQVLRGYAFRSLPTNHDELRAQLTGIMDTQLETLYTIERLWNEGLIHFNCGSTLKSQELWRELMCAAIPGMGMKTVSFALHIYNPAGCLILTVDCWHIRRVCGLGTNESIRHARYLALEAELRRDCALMAEREPGFWAITYAACLWERTRQHYGASEVKNGEYQEHDISCYV